MKTIIEYNNLKILDGINTHPGSGNVHMHKREHLLFNTVLDKITKEAPVMVEVGCFWALWSLLFRQRFPKGKNIIIEFGKRQLDVGKTNFDLNGYSYSSYWGGLFLGDSGTYKNKENDVEYSKVTGEYWNGELSGEVSGPELDFTEIYSNEGLGVIDLLHMDIQGSELPLCLLLEQKNLLQSGKIKNFVIATHSTEIHKKILQLLFMYDYVCSANEPFGSVGGDGLILAGIKR